ncbi:calcium uniporter protein 2, mitochondrial-like [Andrographis paniculata]|uniref:calcium uniporter protein 2, mitochondrial-like n=1 Tax=Andrographis paniculata TaxID=175694 RepID=UPI0021E96A04|nr:calcium uniporter protein 2, mitochondrial-like [Andrographis paniculata]
MAFRRVVAQRLFGVSRMAVTNCRVSSPCTAAQSKVLNQAGSRIASDPGDYYGFIFRRYIHRHSSSLSPGLRFLPTGEKLVEKVRELDNARSGRIRLDGLRLAKEEEEAAAAAAAEEEGKQVLKDAVKILQLSQLEMVKSSLKKVEKDCVSYPEFVDICAKACASVDDGVRFAKMLDQSGSVIVFGNTVFLKPEKIVKAIQGLIPGAAAPPLLTTGEDSRRKELQKMEEQKAGIDRRARQAVRRELWGGLGFLVVQTVAFMRLTFWELSWDVMEPICFYVTSMYFMAGYAFFLRTSKEPSFEGFFHSRFSAKQRRLMQACNFDAHRYDMLKKMVL